MSLNEFETEDGNDCATEPYMFEALSREALTLAFQKHPCCKKHCVSVICNLPSSEQECCPTCFPSGMEYCRSTQSSRRIGDSDDQRDYFNRVITATRKAWQKYQILPEDDDVVKSEKNKHFDDELMRHFQQGRSVNGKYNWKECYYIFLPDGTKSNVCKSSWIGITGITRGKVEYAQGRVKRGQEPIKSYMDDNEVVDVAKAFDYWGMDYDKYRGHIQAYCNFDKVGENKGSIIAVAYLSDLFDLIGEAQPDVAYIHYDPITYRELYDTYISDPFVNTIAQGRDIISYESFCRILREVFTNVRPREYKSVAGKCHVCEKIRSTMKACTLRSDRIILKRYRLFHRNKFMGEKIKYYQRQQEAHESNGRVWSFIFDGMSKHRTRLPILSHLAQMSNQFDNDVLGCIFHNGMRTQLYISGPSVQLGASYMIHCIHEEIRRLLEDKGMPPPDKIYLQIDGASDNTAYVVFAALEHLVAAGLCSTIEVWRLPVGHTHEDIDGRFGVLSMQIRDQSIETTQKFFAEARFAFRGECDITYIAAIYAYKEFYEAFLDKHIMVKKQDYTNLGFRFQRLSEAEREDDRYNHLLDVKVNYKKVAQDITVDLRPMNPLYNETSESTNASCFYPVALLSYWQPEKSIYERDQLPGISFMVQRPHGTPKPLECAKWVDAERRFMGDMRKKYHLTSEEYIFKSWEAHYREHMPTVPNSNPPVPSDNIAHYMAKMGSDFCPPLGKYLYGPSPMTFKHFRNQMVPRSICDSVSCTSTDIDSEPENAFTDQYQSKATWVDNLIKSVVVQAHQTIPHRLNKVPFRRWEFDSPEMMQGVIINVKVQKEDSEKYEMRLMPGRIVAFSDDDVNHAPMFRVCLFNDDFPLKPKRYVDIVKETEYYDARFRYRTKYPHEETGLDDQWDDKRANAKAREQRRIEAEEKQREREQRQAQAQAEQLEKALAVQTRREQKAREREEEKERRQAQAQAEQQQRALAAQARRELKAREKEERDLKKAEEKDRKKIETENRKRMAKEQKAAKNAAGKQTCRRQRKDTIYDGSMADDDEDDGEQMEEEEEKNDDGVADDDEDDGGVADDDEDDGDVADDDEDNGDVALPGREDYGDDEDVRQFVIDDERANVEDVNNAVDELVDDDQMKIADDNKGTKSSVRRRRKVAFDEDDLRCECGCGLLYEAFELVQCRGGTRRVNSTGCTKRIGKDCCPNWECGDCEKPKDICLKAKQSTIKAILDERNTDGVDNNEPSVGATDLESSRQLTAAASEVTAQDISRGLSTKDTENNLTNTSSRPSRIRKPTICSNSTILCECGCGELLTATEATQCRGGTRDVDATGCTKRIGKRCCPQWTCSDCERI